MIPLILDTEKEAEVMEEAERLVNEAEGALIDTKDALPLMVILPTVTLPETATFSPTKRFLVTLAPPRIERAPVVPTLVELAVEEMITLLLMPKVLESKDNCSMDTRGFVPLPITILLAENDVFPVPP